MSGILPFQGAPALLLVEQGHVLGLQPRDGLGPVVLGVKMDLPDLGGGNDQLSSCGGNDSHFLTLIPPLTPTEYLHSSLRGSAPSQRGQALFLLRSEPRSAARLSRSRIPPPACGPRGPRFLGPLQCRPLRRPLRSASGPLHLLLARPGTLLPHAAAFEGSTDLPRSLSNASTAGFAEPPASPRQPRGFRLTTPPPRLFPIVLFPPCVTFESRREAQKIGGMNE